MLTSRTRRAVAVFLVVQACWVWSSACGAAGGVIYSDDFDGSGPLNGAIPDVRPGSQTWAASPVFGADGSVSTTTGPSGYTYQALLPFTPDAGQVYLLSLDVDPSMVGGAGTDLTQWFALGFSNSDSTDGVAWWDSGVAWVLHRIDRNRTENDEIQTFQGPGMANVLSHPSKDTGMVRLTVILDTTQGRWTVEWVRNGQSIRGPVVFAANPAITHAGFTKSFQAGGRVDNFELRLSDLTAALPRNPSPAHEAVEVERGTALTWVPGADARTHDVYLGTVLESVANAGRADPLGVLVRENQDANHFDTKGLLDLGQTYYWRVDEVSGAVPPVVTKGPVWSFTVERRSYPVAGVTATASSVQPGYGPENTVNGSGLDPQDGHSNAAVDMWQSAAGAAQPVWIQYALGKVYKLDEMRVWNYNGALEYVVGFGLKDVMVEHSLDGATWTVLGDFVFAQGTSAAGYQANTTVGFGGVAAQYVRLTVKSSYGSMGYYGLSEVRFLAIPTFARQAQPESGSTQVDPEVVLSWRSGRDAVSHEVYLRADRQAVEGGTALVGTVSENRYAAEGLELGTTYYWKVNEVNTAEPVPVWEGDVWEFRTQEFYLVDGFEGYNDNKDAGTVIWQVWKDGYETMDNGSVVGHDEPPYAERDIVRSGRQSMQFAYNNGGTVERSEAVRQLDPPEDWTRGGAKSLVLYFYGVPENTWGRPYVRINGVTVVYGGDPGDLAKESWVQWTVDLGQVGVDLGQVRTLAVGVDTGGSGTLYLDDIRLYREVP